MEENILKIIKEISLKLKDSDFIENNLSNEKVLWNPISLVNGYPSILLLLGELMSIDSVEEWENIAHEYVVKINNELEDGFNHSSLFTGLSGIAAGVYSISLNGSRYRNVLNELNTLILSYTKEWLSEIIQDNETKDYYYDTITGLSGILRYLIEIKNENGVEEVIKSILEYFVLLSGDRSSSRGYIPRYLVKNESAGANELDNEDLIINMGLAHGIAGVMISMSIALKNGIEVIGQREAIEKLLKVYKECKIDEGKRIRWPGQLLYENFIKSKRNKGAERASWCYGLPGIARAIYVTSKIVNDEDGIELSLEALRRQAISDLDEYELNSPTICHGFSGVLIINELMYRDTEEIIFKEANVKIAKRILEYYNKDNIVGFKNIEIMNNEIEETDNTGFLSGVSGVLLALMYFINKNNTHWEKFLLLD